MVLKPFFIIYKYSLRGIKNRIEDIAIKNFTDFDFDLDDLDNLRNGEKNDNK